MGLTFIPLLAWNYKWFLWCILQYGSELGWVSKHYNQSIEGSDVLFCWPFAINCSSVLSALERKCLFLGTLPGLSFRVPGLFFRAPCPQHRSVPFSSSAVVWPQPVGCTASHSGGNAWHLRHLQGCSPSSFFTEHLVAAHLLAGVT